MIHSMATILSPTALLSSSSSAAHKPYQASVNPSLQIPSHHKPLITSLTSTLAAATIFAAATTSALPALADPNYFMYYGTASSAANYGGFGGNSDKKASAEYVYEVPDGWRERLVSKVEKGTNGTDSEFYNPKKKTEKEYLTYLAGFSTLAPMDVVLNNLALSDVDLQDLIYAADNMKSEEMKDENGQIYYVYEVDGIGKHCLIKVTCARNKLYAHFVNAPAPQWGTDEATLRHLHDSFKTVE